ncbi:MAG: ribonuclease HII [Bradymonadaceae bacterium]|nr:ribonuclease HII [Lujinxingiaceae bacterium]
MQVELFSVAESSVGEIETWCLSHQLRTVVGIDEAGRGPLAGPVYAAAVVLDFAQIDAPWLAGLDDSKKLSTAQREVAYDAIIENARAWAITSSDNQRIDQINILQATFRAMEAALEQVCAQLEEPPQCVFIDGNLPIQTALRQRAIVKGDGRSLHIAAASILAKVARDRIMADHDQRWPEYGFASHKGYPTQAHRKAIEVFGPCAIHRLSFGGVREHADRLRDDSDLV